MGDGVWRSQHLLLGPGHLSWGGEAAAPVGPGVPRFLQAPQSSLASEPGTERPFLELHFQQPLDPPPPWSIFGPL